MAVSTNHRSIEMSFFSTIERMIARIGRVDASAPPAPVPTPIPVTPTQIPSSGTKLMLRHKRRPGAHWYTITEWPPVGAMLFGASEVFVSKISGGLWFQAEFTVLDGALTVTTWGVGGSHKPRMILKRSFLGIKRAVSHGDVLNKGDVLFVDFILGDTSDIKHYPMDANYGVHTAELGQIVALTAWVHK
jgi:hypothetical protein